MAPPKNGITVGNPFAKKKPNNPAFLQREEGSVDEAKLPDCSSSPPRESPSPEGAASPHFRHDSSSHTHTHTLAGLLRAEQLSPEETISLRCVRIKSTSEAFAGAADQDKLRVTANVGRSWGTEKHAFRETFHLPASVLLAQRELMLELELFSQQSEPSTTKTPSPFHRQETPTHQQQQQQQQQQPLPLRRLGKVQIPTSQLSEVYYEQPTELSFPVKKPPLSH